MKKVIIVSLAVVFVAALVPQKLSAAVGVKGGEAWSSLRFNYANPPSFSVDSRKQIVVGGFASFSLAIIKIQPEALYVRMGAAYIAGPDNLAYQLDYIQVPVLIKINIVPVGPIKPCVFAGPYGSLLLSARRVSDAGGSHSDASIKNETRSTDYGIVFGAGVDFNLPLIKVTVDARYCLGMANIDKAATGTDTLKNKAIMVLAGIGF